MSSYCYMTSISDQQYINEIIEGNSSAYAVLVDRYKNLVYTLALKMVRNHEEAEEIAQDTFVKIYKSLGNFKGESKFSTWVYRVTYNTCLDRLKQLKRKQQVEYIEDFDPAQTRSIERTVEVIDEKEINQKIHHCLNLLPGEDAFLLTLFYFEEQSLEEISKVIGTNANNVKVKLFRSRKKLAAVLKQQVEPEIIAYYEGAQKSARTS